jgi:hypothetical protein
MSTSGLTNQFIPSTLDGLVVINADEINIGGNPIDIATLVPYTGADKPVDVGVQPIRTNYAPVANADVVNLLTLQNAVAYIEGINVANFVPYTGSNANVDLGTYKISSSTAPSTGNNLTNKTYVDTQDNAVANFASATYVGYTNSFKDVDLTLVGNNSLKGYNLTATNKVIAPTAQFTGITSAAPALALGVDGSGNLNTFAVPSGASFPFTGTTNINGGLQTLQNATQFNPSLDANSYFITGVSPTTYVFTTNWTVNPVSGTTANIQLDPAAFYFDTAHKYIISFTGIYGTGATWVGTVFNNSTSLTVSDASIAITTSPQNLSMTFTAGSSSPTIYLRFVGASGTLRFTNFTIKEVDVEIMGNLILSSDIDSNIVQSNGRTANLAGGLRVAQSSLATAPSLTTFNLPTGVSASTLSGAYSLTATAGGSTFGMWLGGSFTYTAGAKYTYTFTGFSTNATATQAMILYTNTYSGGTGTSIGDYLVNVPITSSTVSGSFTATSNNNVVWNFVSSAAGRSISFSGFTLTRADVQIGGISTNVVPYVSSTGLTNSIMSIANTSLGYSGASFTASTGIGSITFSSPTYTANSSASVQGIINASAIPNIYLNVPCVATITAASFPFYAVSPYPYFTLTNGSTVVYTSPVGASGTISMPFTPTSTTLFITLYFKAPPTPQTAGIFTWTNFTITTNTMTTTGNTTINGTQIVNGIANIHGGSPSAVPTGYMSAGSLTIGDVAKNYGGGTTYWNSNTAGLLLECLDNTEIAVHDAGARVSSMMRYNANTLTLGRDMGWGVANTAIAGTLDTASNITMASGTFRKNSSANPNNWAAIQEGGAANSPYMEFYYGSLRRGYIGNATASALYLVAENNCDFNLYTGGGLRMIVKNSGLTGFGRDPSYTVDINGNQRVFNGLNGNDSKTVYGPNATWSAYLVVGAGSDSSGGATAQVISTNGNLHLDAGNSNSMYYGYYANNRGTPNTHEFWGSTINFNSGLPQNTSPYSGVMCMDGNSLRRSQAVNKLVYFNNNVAWGGGVNMTYAFYLYNTTCSVYIWGKNSGYYTGGGMMQTMIRVYSQSAGTYYYFPINAYVNNGYNHFTVPLDYATTFPYTGWYDIYVYSTSGWITDGNDQLTIGVSILPVNAF